MNAEVQNNGPSALDSQVEIDNRPWTEAEVGEFEANVAVSRERREEDKQAEARGDLLWGPVETLPNGVRIQRQVERVPACI